MALFAGLRQPAPLAGIMCLSGYLPLADTLDAEAAATSLHVPIFQAHGSVDPMVPPDLAHRTRDRLTAGGYGVDYHEYAMAHQICHEEVRDIGDWLAGVLAPAPHE